MSTFIRLLAFVVVGLSALLTGGFLMAALGAPLLFDDETLRACQVWWREIIRDEALTARDGASQRSIAAKFEVVSALADGKLTLAEAIDRFRELRTLTDDGQDDLLGSYYLTPMSDESLGRHILDWVEMQLRDDPRREALVARLEKELAARSKGPRAH